MELWTASARPVVLYNPLDIIALWSRNITVVEVPLRTPHLHLPLPEDRQAARSVEQGVPPAASLMLVDRDHLAHALSVDISFEDIPAMRYGLECIRDHLRPDFTQTTRRAANSSMAEHTMSAGGGVSGLAELGVSSVATKMSVISSRLPR